LDESVDYKGKKSILPSEENIQEKP
jgi:hypothetical protein